MTTILTENLPFNLSFETGDFSDWQTIGSASIETSDFGVDPTDGEFQALITNDFDSVSDSELENFLGLNVGDLDNLGLGDATEGSALQLLPISVEAGDILTFDWNFLTNEATPSTFNDFGFVSISSQLLSPVADTNSEFVFFDGLFNEQTGYGTFEYQFTTAGTFNLAVGVVDVEDTFADSALLVDNFSVTSTTDTDLGFFEPNDSIFQATETGIFGSGSEFFSAFIGDGEFGDTSGDYDYFKLSADAGDIITIETFADIIGSNLNTIVGLFDSSGDLLTFNNNGGFGSDSLLTYEVQVTDDYYAAVAGVGSGAPDPFTPGSGNGVGSTGEYELIVAVEGPVLI